MEEIITDKTETEVNEYDTTEKKWEENKQEQEWQCKYNVTLRRVGATNFALEKL
jgi:hypothetical protein